jgi:hypothetical protein
MASDSCVLKIYLSDEDDDNMGLESIKAMSDCEMTHYSINDNENARLDNCSDMEKAYEYFEHRQLAETSKTIIFEGKKNGTQVSVRVPQIMNELDRLNFDKIFSLPISPAECQDLCTETTEKFNNYLPNMLDSFSGTSLKQSHESTYAKKLNQLALGVVFIGTKHSIGNAVVMESFSAFFLLRENLNVPFYIDDFFYCKLGQKDNFLEKDIVWGDLSKIVSNYPDIEYLYFAKPNDLVQNLIESNILPFITTQYSNRVLIPKEKLYNVYENYHFSKSIYAVKECINKHTNKWCGICLGLNILQTLFAPQKPKTYHDNRKTLGSSIMDTLRNLPPNIILQEGTYNNGGRYLINICDLQAQRARNYENHKRRKNNYK